ncbi:uncharacterized protein DS421_7g216220 [Arachis hypogaea]|nr:uncharacterized protein DS421_7g216220 [Arachis hypogaea]
MLTRDKEKRRDQAEGTVVLDSLTADHRRCKEDAAFRDEYDTTQGHAACRCPAAKLWQSPASMAVAVAVCNEDRVVW